MFPHVVGLCLHCICQLFIYAQGRGERRYNHLICRPFELKTSPSCSPSAGCQERSCAGPFLTLLHPQTSSGREDGRNSPPLEVWECAVFWRIEGLGENKLCVHPQTKPTVNSCSKGKAPMHGGFFSASTGICSHLSNIFLVIQPQLPHMKQMELYWEHRAKKYVNKK